MPQIKDRRIVLITNTHPSEGFARDALAPLIEEELTKRGGLVRRVRIPDMEVSMRGDRIPWWEAALESDDQKLLFRNYREQRIAETIGTDTGELPITVHDGFACADRLGYVRKIGNPPMMVVEALVGRREITDEELEIRNRAGERYLHGSTGHHLILKSDTELPRAKDILDSGKIKHIADLITEIADTKNTEDIRFF